MGELSENALRVIAAAREKIVDIGVNPLLEQLPKKFRDSGLRDHQVTAIKSVLAAYEYVPVVVLDAPTGTGKTLVAEVVRLMLKARAVYVCNSKSLQDQFLRDFDYAKIIKGRANYPTECFPQRYDPSDWGQHLSCQDCTATPSNEFSCKWCNAKWSCPYEKAKNAALNSKLAVLNVSYFLAEANHVGRFSGKDESGKPRRRDLVIADEADTLESALMGYVSVEVTERRMEKYGWFPPAKTTVPSSWKDWINETIPDISRRVRALPPEEQSTVADERERKYLLELWEKLYRVRKDLDTEDHAWVYTGKGSSGGGRNAKNVGREVAFKPSHVSAFGDDMLWKHGPRWLLMSATVISAEELLGSLGYKGAYEVVRVPHTFPKRNRQVKVVANVNMAAANKLTAWPKVGSDVASIVARHPGQRILIHSVSYDLTRSIVDRVGQSTDRAVLSYSSAAYRETALSRFVKSDAGVLVAPSMDRGIDLPDDACRVQILVKCPFPYIGDKQVAARMHSRGGDVWYAVQTIRSIVQMCGRAIRSVDDWAVTYVLDEQFKTNLWARHRGLFPQWFVEGLVW